MKMMTSSTAIRFLAATVFAVCTLMIAPLSPVLAQTKPAAKPVAKKAPDAAKTKVGSSAKTPKIKKGAKMAKPKAQKGGSIDLGEMRVEGKLVKPEVFYVLRRQKPQYKDLKLKRSFVRLIIRSARTNPF